MEPPQEPAATTFALDDLVGQVFADRYQVQRLVSEGATMALYDVIDDTGRPVSLKLVRPRLAAPPSFRARFDQQMRAVAALSHPNIAAVYDWGIAPVGDVSTAYVVAEQLTGGSLRDMFDRGRRLTPSQALVVGLDACRALDYAHRRGFVHAELTPSKLVFGDDRRLRIVDFGLARLLGERAWTNPEEHVHNHVAWYAAPEQAQGAMVDGTVDGKADVYALCLSLHEAVTGTVPFRADSTVASLTARVGRLMPVSADLGPLAAVLERAGRPDPAERASAAEFGKALVAAASKLPRPEPLPLFASGLFEVAPEELRSPDDPTGGVRRREPVRQADPDARTELLVVPVDEPDPEVADEPDPVAAPPPVIPDGPREPLSAGGDLVILPLDTGIDPQAAPPATPARVTSPTEAVPVIDQRAPRRRRRFPWKILLGLLVIGALVTLGVLAALYFARTPTHVVPDLTGMPEAEARNLIAPNDWVVSKQTERSDDVSEIGAIVRTAPTAGAELAEGEPFLIVVSDGPTLRPLPDVGGMALPDALAALTERGLAPDTVEEHHETVPANTVIRWEVPGDPTLVAGAEVLPDTVVRMVVSLGPAPRTVPNLVGVDMNGARVAVESEQLVFRVEAEQQFSDEIAAGSVMWQSIEPGTEVPRGSEIVVIISKGPDVVPFPDLSQSPTFNDAKAVLEAAGFGAELTFGDAEGAVQEYTIDGAVPNPGEMYRRGTVVQFVAITTD